MPDRAISELALLGVFAAVAVGFIALTTTFRSSSPRLFPRLTGAVILVGVALLLTERWLPAPVRRIVAEPVDIVDRDGFAEYDSVDAGAPADGDAAGPAPGRQAEAEADGAETRRGRFGPLARLTPRQFTFAAIAGYVGASYVLSVLVATPLFVLAYGAWNRQPRWVVAVLTVLSIGICLLFVSLANAPLDQSLLFPRGIR